MYNKSGQKYAMEIITSIIDENDISYACINILHRFIDLPLLCLFQNIINAILWLLVEVT